MLDILTSTTHFRGGFLPPLNSRIVVHSIHALAAPCSRHWWRWWLSWRCDDADDDQMICGQKGRQGGRIGASLLFPPTRPNKTILMMTMATMRPVITIINHHHLNDYGFNPYHDCQGNDEKANQLLASASASFCNSSLLWGIFKTQIGNHRQRLNPGVDDDDGNDDERSCSNVQGVSKKLLQVLLEISRSHSRSQHP